MKKISVIISLVFVIFMTGGCAKQEESQKNPPPQNPNQSNEINSEKSCLNDTDCSCGRHKDTKQCFYGNIKYIDPSSNPCPDFCDGFDGKSTSKCISGECKQTR
jgi:hypothetical protein